MGTSKQSETLEIQRFQGFSYPKRFAFFVNTAKDMTRQKRTEKDRIIPGGNGMIGASGQGGNERWSG